MCFVESFSNEKTEVDIMGRKMNKKEVAQCHYDYMHASIKQVASTRKHH